MLVDICLFNQIFGTKNAKLKKLLKILYMINITRFCIILTFTINSITLNFIGVIARYMQSIIVNRVRLINIFSIIVNTPKLIANTPKLIAYTPIVIAHNLVPKQ